MSAQPAPPREDLDDDDVDGHLPGDVVAGKYLLLRVLGCGGMGTVWAAKNLDLDLEVAVKLINPHLDSEETRARLATEARAEARVQHPGIVRVLDLGVTDQGEPFLVMERLAGRSLGDLLDERGHLEPVDAVRIMLPVLEALAAVHEKGVVHRDLKPDNIFLSEHGGRLQPKIVDFGIAKLEGAPSPRRTGQGAVVGSPGYMAPEHARGIDVDQRADVFTVALVIYECITGQPAFQGSNYNALLRAVIERELPPITSFGRGDPALSRILERGLRKDPATRYGSCGELGRALATWLLSRGETEDVTGHALSEWWQADESTPRSNPTSHGLSVRTARRAGLPEAAGQMGPASVHAVSFSASRVASSAPFRRRLAFVALACSGFAGGFAATTTGSDFLPRQLSRSTEPRVAAPPPAMENIAPRPAPAGGVAATTAVSIATAKPAPLPPPQPAPPSQKKKPALSSSPYPEPTPPRLDRFPVVAQPAEPSPHPTLTLPPEPEQEPSSPSGLARPNNPQADLKDPYR